MPAVVCGFMTRNQHRLAGVQAASLEDAITMTVAAAESLVRAVAIYLGSGAVFAMVFLWRWVGILDTAASHGTWGFRTLVFPGVAMLWPLFLIRVIRR